MSRILQNHYVLAVRDAGRTADFYVSMLGFKIVAQPTGWMFIERDNCTIMLCESPDDVPASELGAHSYFAYLRVEDADVYHRHLTLKGAGGLTPISDKPWGLREFSLLTPDGHRIAFGHVLKSVGTHQPKHG